MIKTFVLYGTTFVLSTILLVVMVDYSSISNIIAPILNLIITTQLKFAIK